MLALNSNHPESIADQTIRDKCALAMLSKYVHDNVTGNDEAYYMTAPNNDIITMHYALGVLDNIVDNM